MGKINTLDDLHKLRNDLKAGKTFRKPGKASGDMVKIKVAMATCSIASGSRDTMNFLTEALGKRNIESSVTQTGCMGYCYAEPTVEVTLPGKEPVVFGYVDVKRADEIIEKYIRLGETVDGMIPVNYRSIEDTSN